MLSELEIGKTTLTIIQNLIDKGIDRMSILMRHSARQYDFDHPQREPFMALTEEGKEFAFSFGQHLPKGFTIRPFSSVFGRCIETAYLIDKGYVAKHGNTEHNTIENLLSPSFVKKPFELAQIMGAKLPDFVRYWFEGNISPEIIEEPETAAWSIAQMLSARLDDLDEKHINIGVTHDWNLYLVKEHIMGLKHEEVGKVSYLEGIAFYREEGQLYVMGHQNDPIPVIF